MRAKKLGERLIEAGLLTPEQLRQALSEQQRYPAPLGVKLITLGLIDETDLLLTLSAQLSAPSAQLDRRRIPDEVIDRVPLEVADAYYCIPLFLRGTGKQQELFLAMADPTDLAAIDELGFRLGCRIRPVLALHGQLVDAIDRHYRGKRVPHEVLACNLDAFAPEIDLEEVPEEPVIELRGGGELEESGPGHEVVFQPVRATDAESQSAPASARAVLRALIELLVERGVIGPQEIAERLKQRRDRPQ